MKPEKKGRYSYLPSMDCGNVQQASIIAHNQALDDYEAFLPNEEEVYDMVIGVGEPSRTRITKAFIKRISRRNKV